MATKWPEKRRIIGTKVSRIDGGAKATGRARYSFDINRPGMLHAAILRSPHAHAKIKSIDTAEAEKAPGFKALYMISKVGGELFYAGDEILAIAADTEEHCRDALRLVKIEFDQLPFQVREEDVLQQDLKTGPPITGMGMETRENLRPFTEPPGRGNVAEALKGADFTHEGNYGMPTICHQCLESHGLVAEWNQEQTKLTVW